MMNKLFFSFVLMFSVTVVFAQPAQGLRSAVMQMARLADNFPASTASMRRPADIQIQLDSSIRVDDFQNLEYGHFYGYDNNHNNLWENDYDYLSAYSPENIQYQYDSNGQLIYSDRTDYDNAQNVVSRYIKTLSYNGSQQLSVQVDSTYDGTGWTAQKFLFSQYNSNNKPEQIIQQDYDASAGGYVNTYKVNISYDSQARITLLMVYQWNNNSWNRYARLRRSYDSQGNISEDLIQAWATVTWYDYDKKHVDIQTNGSNEIHTITHTQRPGTSWENVDKDIFEFNAAGTVIRHEYYEWDDNNSQWKGMSKYIITLSTTGNLMDTQKDYYPWDDANNDWQSQANEREVHRYDLTTSADDVAWPRSFDNWDYKEHLLGGPWYKYYGHPLEYKINYKERYAYDSSSNSWDLDSHEDYYYGQLMGVSSQSVPGLQVEPNPFGNVLVFDWDAREGQNANLQIFDLTGKPVWTGEIIKAGSIDVAHLTAGIYIYRLQTSAGTSTGKLIKK